MTVYVVTESLDTNVTGVIGVSVFSRQDLAQAHSKAIKKESPASLVSVFERCILTEEVS